MQDSIDRRSRNQAMISNSSKVDRIERADRLRCSRLVAEADVAGNGAKRRVEAAIQKTYRKHWKAHDINERIAQAVFK
jgi:hypothetical protein